MISGATAIGLWILGLQTISGRGFRHAIYPLHVDFGEAHIWVGIIFLGAGVWFAYYAMSGSKASRS